MDSLMCFLIVFFLFTVYNTLILSCRDTKERRDREFERSEEKEIRIKQEPPDGETKMSTYLYFVTLHYYSCRFFVSCFIDIEHSRRKCM
jgi:hypothetical protein